MKQIGVLIILITCFASCSNFDKRIKLIEKELQIHLPIKYEVLKDEDISHNGFESDYTLILKLKFEQKEFDSVISQIKLSPFFQYANNLSSPAESKSITRKMIADSLETSLYRGIWIITENGFEFKDQGNKREPIAGEVNTADRTLEFTFNHL